MADVNIQLNRQYVSAGSSVSATGGPYTVSASGTITVADSDEATVRTELGAIVEGGTPTVIPTLFCRSLTGALADDATNKQTIFSLLAGQKAVILHVVVRNASAALTSIELGAGWDNNASDVAPPAAIDALSAANYGAFLTLSTNPFDVGGDLSGIDFGIKVTNAGPGGATFDVDVVGYFV